MRKTKKLRHQPALEGIYLDDLNLEQMDPELAALYLYHPKKYVSTITANFCFVIALWQSVSNRTD